LHRQSDADLFDLFGFPNAHRVLPDMAQLSHFPQAHNLLGMWNGTLEGSKTYKLPGALSAFNAVTSMVMTLTSIQSTLRTTEFGNMSVDSLTAAFVTDRSLLELFL